MTAIILVIHLFIAIAMIGVILLQKSEGGGLGMGGGGMSGFMTGRSTANLLTRTTAILAACFVATSIVLALLAGAQRVPRAIVVAPPASAPATTPAAPATAPAAPATTQTAPATTPSAPETAPAAPAAPATPSVPLAK